MKKYIPFVLVLSLLCTCTSAFADGPRGGNRGGGGVDKSGMTELKVRRPRAGTGEYSNMVSTIIRESPIQAR